MDTSYISDLIAAICNGDYSLCETLLTQEIDPNTSYDNAFPLEWALYSGYKNIARLLIKHGAYKYNIVTFLQILEKNDKFIDDFLDVGIDINAEIDGKNLLSEAIMQNRVYIIELLLKNGADPNNISCIKHTLLYLAYVSNYKYEIITLLFKYNINVNSRNNKLQTILHELCIHNASYRETQIENLIRNHNADVNAIDNKGNTPLIYAVKKYSKYAIKILLKYGANCNIINRNGTTALLKVCKKPNSATISITKKLLINGADPCIANNNSRSPLHILVENRNNKDLIKLLLDYGANIDAADINGDTPLHLNLMGVGYYTKLLLDNNANIDIVNNDGKKPMHIAITKRLTTDIYYIYDIIKRKINTAHFVCMVREFDDTSVFHGDYLCLDLFKVILRFI